MERLKGKIALITGGTSGIGLATAKLFRSEGAQLIITGRNLDRLASAQKELGSETMVIRSEAGDLAEIDSLMQQIKSRFPRLDVLFLNAAVVIPSPFEAVTEAQFDEITNINFKGEFFTIQKALPLLSNNASIILTTSITNQNASPMASVYAASKAALRSLVRSTALSLISRGIRVNAVCPGTISTPGFNNIDLPAEVIDAIMSDIVGRSPIKRLGTPEEVANAVLFLASDEASYIVGQELVIDGGMTQVCLP